MVISRSMNPAAWLLAALCVFLLTSCQSDNFLEEVVPPPAPKEVIAYDRVHAIAGLTGSNDVDLLWVIDNSGSMGDHQKSLIQNMQIFMDVFVQKKIHWKMGIISTDIYDKPYLGFDASSPFDWKSGDPILLFNMAVRNLGIGGSGYEKMFDPVMTTLAQSHPDFVRKGVPLAIVVITDAPEQSSSSAADFLYILSLVKKGIDHVVVYGVLGASEFCKYSSDDYWKYNPSSKYKQVIEATNGKAWSLCSDFGLSLDEIAQNLVSRITHAKIYLDGRPNSRTLKVIYEGEELPGGQKEDGGYWLYDYDLNAVVFWDLDFAPGDNESVRVVYEPQ